ncbi:type I DNA topoisomerase [Candidatus Microgenomates bacterium]|nr:type I DNA topoisomerase [Candidatus Microgenomates bacterium]
MNLVIVESPTKAKTLGKFLGDDYKIVASMGHVRDLPASRLGIDVNHDFEPQYQTLADHKKVIDELKSLRDKAQSVILATDPDREGEAIAFHLTHVLGKGKVKESPYLRITFHEITQEAIKEALKEPRTIDMKLVDAQQARRVLDRLVGYKLSPLLWSKVRRGLSAGRVQSVALRIICEREREIEKFAKEEYWTVTASLKNNSQNIVDFELISKNGVKYETSTSYDLYDGKYNSSKTTISTQQQAQEIVDELNKLALFVLSVEKKASKRYPSPPFTTSTLQQEAGRRFGYSGKKTMQIAQRLYEQGYITYHRTDSTNLNMDAVSKAREYIKSEFGQEYVPLAPKFYKTKQKLAQEAHEAIRPTNVRNAGKLGEEAGREEERLYNLIWKKFVACQMREAEIEGTSVLVSDKLSNEKKVASEEQSNIKKQELSIKSEGYILKATGSVIVFPGFLKIYPESLEDKSLPVFNEGEELQKEKIFSVNHETTPPPLYTEASLVATMEERGIGRPSTYAPTIATILDRHYVEKEERKLKPTPLGFAVNDFLVKNFSEIDDMPFTAKMEDQLDEVAQGQKEWVGIIRDFFTPFSEKTKSVYTNSERVKIETEETDEKCDVCGSPMVVRIGRFGRFLACSRFPDCKSTKPLVKKVADLKCPEDGGDVIIKRTKRGKMFYGCSNYPNCKWASWTKPK